MTCKRYQVKKCFGTRRMIKLYVSDNDMKARILAGQIEILDNVLNDLRKWNDEYVMLGNKVTATTLQVLIIKHSKFRTQLAREKRELETE